MKSRILLATIVGIAATCPVSATVVAIDYNTGFATPTQVITSDQPYGTMGGDPGTGVTFSNPFFFHTLTSLENNAPTGYGGSVTVGFPGLADSFGLEVSVDDSFDPGLFHLDFYLDTTWVGSASVLMPANSPLIPVSAAFHSDVSFSKVVLTAPFNGFMRIGQDSIKFQAVDSTSVPDALDTLPALAVVLAGFVALRRKIVAC